jgi:hypothetical protein
MKHSVTTLLLSILLLASGCVGTNQSAKDLLNCTGGDLKLTGYAFDNANANRKTLHTTKVVTSLNPSSALGMVLTSSQCPLPLDEADRTVTITLYEHPVVGKTYTLGAASGTNPSYLDYSEVAVNIAKATRTTRSWIASGTLTVTSISGETIIFSGKNLLMTARTDQSGNSATGNFRMDIDVRADNVPGL